MQKLREYLRAQSPGPIDDDWALSSLLAACWDELDYSPEAGMDADADKLIGRMENVYWDPPLLTFKIERHGGIPKGSTRAEIQPWTVDIENRSAICGRPTSRQIRPRAPSLNVKPLAKQTADLILTGHSDNRLKWNDDGSVRVLIGEIIPSGSAYKQTLGGQRRRFRDEVERLLSNRGWQKVRVNVYAPSTR